LKPIYQKTASYGHFGRNEPEFTWEKTDMATKIRIQCSSNRQKIRSGKSKKRLAIDNPGEP